MMSSRLRAIVLFVAIAPLGCGHHDGSELPRAAAAPVVDVSSDAVALHAITLDASELTEQQLSLPGVVDSFDSQTPKTVQMASGVYTLVSTAQRSPLGRFTVTADGTISYEVALDSTFLGAGTSTLMVHAYTIRIDGNRLPPQPLTIASIASFVSSSPVSLKLAPGTYALSAGSRSAGAFRVTPNGMVDYDHVLEGTFKQTDGHTLDIEAIPANISIQSQLDHDILIYDTPYFVTAHSTEPLALPPGDYAFMTYSSTFASVSFSITADGNVTYDPSFEGVILGQDTPTLTIAGRPVTIDATRLSQTAILPMWFNAQLFDTRQVQTLNMIPCDGYWFEVGSSMAANFGWQVDLAGTVHFSSDFNTIASGDGTNRLALLGAPVTITSSAVNDAFILTSVLGDPITLSSQQINYLTLMPLYPGLGYDFIIGSSQLSSLSFNIDTNGNFIYDSTFDSYVYGRGTTALNIDPPLITVDASESGPGQFQLSSIIGGATFDRAKPQSMRLFPLSNPYLYVDDQGTFSFLVRDDGTIDYDSSLDAILVGRGTSQVVRHPTPWLAPPPPPGYSSDGTATLVGRWPLDEGADPVVHDTSGQGNDGLLGGSTLPTWNDDGPSLTFAPPSYVSVPRTPVLEADHVSIELWAKDALASSPSSAVSLMTSDGTKVAYAMQVGAANISFGANLGGVWANSPVLTRSIWDSRWHHLAGTYDGSNLRLYVDGIEVDSGIPASGAIAYDVNESLWIGGAAATDNFTGSLADVRIYNDALPVTAIEADATQRLQVDVNQLATPGNTLMPPTDDTATTMSPRGDATSNVTEQGAAGYHLPIWVPPGRNGMEPNFSLNYDSGANNGVVGVGWELSGIPRIARCPRSVYSGLATYGPVEALSPVTFDSNDQLCLGNQRMVVDGGQYRLAHDDHSIVIAHDPDALGPTWFEQRTKDGRTLYFGRDAGTRIEGARAAGSDASQPPGTVRFAWLLSRIVDRAGNFLTVSYYSDLDRRGLPSEVDYTGSAIDASTHRAVRFFYENRPEAHDPAFVSGFAIARTQRLQRIEMWAPDPVEVALLRVFTFTYQASADTGRSLLSLLKECDRPNGLCRTAQFDYSSNNGAVDFQYIDPGITDIQTPESAGNVNPGVTTRLNILDVNGDGRDDILYEASGDGKAHVRLSTGSGVGPRDSGNYFSDSRVLDYDGDGRFEVLALDSKFYPSTHNVILYHSVWDEGAHDWKLDTANVWHQPSRRHAVADLDGDSIPELLMADNASAQWTIHAATQGFNPLGWFDINVDDPIFNDINGDGKMEMLAPLLAFNYDFVANTEGSFFDGLPSGNLIYGDFNGDGVVDTVNVDPGDTLQTRVPPTTSINNGRSFNDAGPLGLDSFSYRAGRVMDWNGDGRADLVVRAWDPDGTGKLMLYQYVNGQWVASATQISVGVTQGVSGAQLFEPLDLNGDGLQDLIMVTQQPFATPATYFYLRQGTMPDLLVGAAGDYGRRTRFSYTPLSSGDVMLSASDPNCVAPIRCIQGKVWTVQTHSFDDGVGGWSSYQHQFSAPLYFDPHGGGLLGFPSHIITDESTGDWTERKFELIPGAGSKSDAPPSGIYPYASLPSQETSRSSYTDVNGNNVLWQRTRIFGYHTTVSSGLLPNTYSYFTYQKSLDESLLEVAAPANGGTAQPGTIVSQHQTTQVQDGYGDITDKTETWPVDDLTRTFHTDYQNDSVNWIIGLPTLVTNSETAAGLTTTRRIGYEYDAKGLVSKEIVEPGEHGDSGYAVLPPQTDQVQTLFTEFNRDAWGLPQLIVRTPNADGSGERRTTQVVYDPLEHMFVASTRDALDHFVQTSYHPGLGVLATRVDENGLTTSYQYDHFGRVRIEHPPVGTDTTTTYRTCAQAGCSGIVLQQHPGFPSKTTYLDSIGREVLSQSQYRGDGRVVDSQTQYDSRGRVAARSRPYFDGDTPSWTRTSYDSLDRATLMTFADGSQLSKKYSGRQTYTYGPTGTQTTQTLDGLGRITQTSQLLIDDADPVGHPVSVSIVYGPFNTELKTIHSGGATNSTSFDRLGRPTLQADPDAGLHLLGYNAFGDQNYELRGASFLGPAPSAGDETRIYFDLAGRQTEVDGVDRTLKLNWDAPHGIGQLASKDTSDGVRQSYGYDDFSRLKSKSWIVGGGSLGVLPMGGNPAAGNGIETFTFSYGYDPQNRPATVTYPQIAGRAAFTITNNYSVGGQLLSVSDASATYWTLQSSDATEEFGVESFGNTAQTTRSEDPSHPGWLSTIATTMNSIAIQDLTYHWDGHERLRGRDDGIAHTSEGFDYDSVDRLRNWRFTEADGSLRTLGYRLDDLGNLRAKNVVSGAGTSVSYTFDSTKFGPHQPASNTLGAFSYDTRGNQTTAPGRTVNYNSLDLPETIDTASASYHFLYDADNSRLGRFTVSNQAGEVLLGFGGLFEEHRNGSETNYTMTVIGGKQRAVAQLKADIFQGQWKPDQTVYLHTDHLGSIDAVSDSNGVVAQLKYEPFGARITPAKPEQPLTDTPDGIRLGYAGEEMDGDDLNLIDMGGRVYDPVQQRFLSLDPIQQLLSPQGSHPYAYARNNPLNRVDPNGFVDEPVASEPSAPDPDPQTSCCADDVQSVDPQAGTVSSTALATSTLGATDSDAAATPGGDDGQRGTNRYVSRVVGQSQRLAETLATDIAARWWAEWTHDIPSFRAWRGSVFKQQTACQLGMSASCLQASASRYANWAIFAYESVIRIKGSSQTGNAIAVDGIIHSTLGDPEIYYRAMKAADFEQLQRTGVMPASSETSISAVREYSAGYRGVLVMLVTAPGTLEELASVGRFEHSEGSWRIQSLFPEMPPSYSGWWSIGTQFKYEGGQITINLGRDVGLDIFNKNLLGYQQIDR